MPRASARPSSEPHTGRPSRRREDPRLLRGDGHYVDDIDLRHQLHVAFVRSPQAHARVISIDAAAALERPSVKAVFTGTDLVGEVGQAPMVWHPKDTEVRVPGSWPLPSRP